MDWVTALCLSTPLAVALCFAARVISRDIRGAVQIATASVTTVLRSQAMRDRTRARAAEKYARRTALLVVEAQGKATVKAARYGARDLITEPPKEPGRRPTAHEVWLGTEGKALPESVRDRVEWAVGRLRGDEDDSQGDEEDAVGILDQFAPGLAESTKDEVRRALGAK
jgi:hypothetical protein